MSDDTSVSEAGPARVPGNDVHDVRDGLVVYRKDNDSVHHLNPMATLFYELADGRSMADIASSMGTIFELESEEAQRVAEIARQELVTRGLIR